MDVWNVALDMAAGWLVWSLGHNLGHRWWHDDMKKGVQTFYAHGEREHHRIYDQHGAVAFQAQEDPRELFISFPFHMVALFALAPVAGYGYWRGWPHALPFACAMYACMLIDHRLHILFHKAVALPRPLEQLRAMHMIHHATHNRNFFFVTGYVWDVLLRTAVTGPVPDARQARGRSDV